MALNRPYRESMGQWNYCRSIASSCVLMALEVNREDPSAFYLSMVALQGVSGESLEAIDSLQALDIVAYDESIASAFNANGVKSSLS